LKRPWLKSHNVEERILRAKDVRSKLEMLEISIVAGDADCSQAAEQYRACIKDASFLES
jgi:hypothetical protein